MQAVDQQETTKHIPEVMPHVVMEGDQLYFSFTFPQARLKVPDKDINAFAVHAVHSLAIVQAKQLLTYATGLKADAQIEISSASQANN